jgi:hypothetical protein
MDIIVQIRYTSNIYDEILGEILIGNNDYKIGETVFVLLDYNKNDFNITNDILTVPSKYIIKINNDYLPQLLPLIRYGTIIYNIIRLFNINKKSKIEIYSDYNIFFLLSKYIKLYTNNIQWVEDINKIKQVDISVIINGNIIEIYNKSIKVCYDLTDVSIFDLYGIENIKEVLDYSEKHDIYADILYVYISEVRNIRNLHNKNTRFIDVISYF